MRVAHQPNSPSFHGAIHEAALVNTRQLSFSPLALLEPGHNVIQTVDAHVQACGKAYLMGLMARSKESRTSCTFLDFGVCRKADRCFWVKSNGSQLQEILPAVHAHGCGHVKAC